MPKFSCVWVSGLLLRLFFRLFRVWMVSVVSGMFWLRILDFDLFGLCV